MSKPLRFTIFKMQRWAKFSTGSEYRPDLQHQGKKPTCTTKQELRLKKNKPCSEKSCLAAFSQREQAFFVFKKRFLNIVSGEGTYRFPSPGMPH